MDEKCCIREIEMLRPMPGDILVVHVDIGVNDGSAEYWEIVKGLNVRLEKKFPQLNFLLTPMGFAKFEVIRPGEGEGQVKNEIV